MDEYEEWETIVSNHWALPLVETPGALVSAIETKISRAVLYEQRRIIGVLENAAYVDGEVMVVELKDDLIARIKGEKK